jgi:hypothetical protein
VLYFSPTFAKMIVPAVGRAGIATGIGTGIGTTAAGTIAFVIVLFVFVVGLVDPSPGRIINFRNKNFMSSHMPMMLPK